jgi:murein L,D-transpeptidase YcbB/YkuD
MWDGCHAAGRQKTAWTDQDGRPTEDARTALSYLRSVEDDALDSRDFNAAELEAQAAYLQAHGGSPADTVAFDAQLTRNMLEYLRQLHLGRVDPLEVGFDFDRRDQEHDFQLLLESALVRHRLRETIADLTPPFAQYRGLRAALGRYRETDPSSSHARQIELAMERLRWLPDLSGSRLLVVNIPMFRLWAFDGGTLGGESSLDMGVIVGRAKATRTPVFSAEMRSIVFRPSWNVPESIVRQEILPAVTRDPEYLQKNDMEMMQRDGRTTVRQLPGPNNALGLVKFVFPNPYDVYMHATPVPELFGEARRDFSHGCVRVEDPVALAVWALADQDGWTREQVLSAMEGTTTKTVGLRRPVRVVLFYTTAVSMPDGTVRFASDIYRYDARLEAALQARQEE